MNFLLLMSHDLVDVFLCGMQIPILSEKHIYLCRVARRYWHALQLYQ